jgi:hypothetical protein
MQHLVDEIESCSPQMQVRKILKPFEDLTAHTFTVNDKQAYLPDNAVGASLLTSGVGCAHPSPLQLSDNHRDSVTDTVGRDPSLPPPASPSNIL